MKKTIIILGAMLMNFCAYGQESLKEKLKSNPIVDSIFTHARTIGIEPMGKYEYDGEYKNTMCFHFDYNKAAEKPKDGEGIYPESVWNANRRQMVDSIRQAFVALSDVSNEMYMKEIHNDRMDTLVYVAILGNNNSLKGNGYIQNTVEYKTANSWTYHYPNAPEYMVFDYHPLNGVKKAEATDRVNLFGQMSYYKKIGGTETLTPKYVDKKSYGKVLNKIFKEKGIKKQHCYVRKDKEFRNVKKWSIGKATNDQEWSTEMKATIYKFPTEKMAWETYKTFSDETWKYIEHHPDMRCEFYYENNTYFYPQVIFSSERELKDKQKERFRVYITCDMSDAWDDTYYFIILDTKMSEFGPEFLPQEWQTLKSWKNGKKVYYKQK